MSAQGQVTYSTAVNLGSFVADGVYPVVLAPQAVLPAGPNTSYSGGVGSGAWGKPNVPLTTAAGAPIATPGDLYDAIGIPAAANPYDLGTAVLLAMSAVPGASGTYSLVRVTDGTDVAAQIPVQDAGTAATLGVTLGSTVAKNDVAGLTFNPPTNTMTITAAAVLNDTIVYTLFDQNGIQVATTTYTAGGSLSTSAVATAAATAFNAGAVGGFVLAVALGSTVVFYSITGYFYSATIAVTPGGGGHVAATLNSAVYQQASSLLPPVNVTAVSQGTNLPHLSKALQQAVDASNAVLGPTAFIANLKPANTASFTLTATLPGTAGNAIILLGYKTSSTMTITPATPTAFAGGGVQGTLFVINAASTGSRGSTGQAQVVESATYNKSAPPSSTNLPAYDITLRIAQAPTQETFRNIQAWVLTSGVYVYDAPTFSANAQAAINNGIPNGRGPSRYWTAAPFGGTPSTNTPWTTGINTPSTLGTDGATGVSSQNLIGTDGISGASRTGMYALRGTGVFQFILAGLGQTISDLGAAQAAYAFAVSELSFFVGPTFPIGTDTPTAVADQAGYNLFDIYGVNVKDWVNYKDPILGTITAKDPLGVALGVIASINPAEYPGNKPAQGIKGILSTERTSIGPYSQAEAGVLSTAGITAVGQYLLAPLYTLINGQNAAGSTAPGQNGVNYTRLTNYILRQIFQILTPLVDQLQGTDPNDPTRVRAKNLVDSLGARLKASGQVVAWQTVCDGTNNTPVTISQGLLLMYIVAEYYGVARFIVPTLLGGTNVEISVGQGQQSLAA